MAKADQLPDELKNVRQWSVSNSKEELKRPLAKHTKYVPDGGFSYKEAKLKAGKDLYMGFYTTKNDPYVLLDIDHVADPDNPFNELPSELAEFLQKSTTYSEISPSGHGIRAIFKVPAPEDKEEVLNSTILIRGEVSPDRKSCQINIGPPWQTITTRPTAFSTSAIQVTSLYELAEIFDIRFKAEEGVRTNLLTDAKSVPSVSEITRALMSLPLDQNPRVRRAFTTVFGGTYQHHDYWLKVLMALHNYTELTGTMVRGLEVAIKWSSKDKDAFSGEGDVIKRWRSFSDKKDRTITYKTILALRNKCVLRWPVVKKQSKEERDKDLPLVPKNQVYDNFKVLVDYYGLKIYRSKSNFFEKYVNR